MNDERPQRHMMFRPPDAVYLRQIHGATKHLEETLVRLDAAATRLQRWSLGIAWSSIAISMAALAVAIIK